MDDRSKDILEKAKALEALRTARVEAAWTAWEWVNGHRCDCVTHSGGRCPFDLSMEVK
jgi:hypothetical protein